MIKPETSNDPVLARQIELLDRIELARTKLYTYCKQAAASKAINASTNTGMVYILADDLRQAFSDAGFTNVQSIIERIKYNA